jgi:hypothetical protein
MDAPLDCESLYFCPPRPALNRHERRKLAALAGPVGRAIAADRRFFARHPERRHYLRRAHASEIDQQRIIQQARLTIAADQRWYACVKNLGDGRRMRHFVILDAGVDCDMTEELARTVWSALATPKVLAMEQNMRR